MKRQFRLSNTPLDVSAVAETMADDTAGGHVLFVGTVRNMSHDRAVIRLEFEAYEPMVMRELEKIADEINERWPVLAVILHHRTGICRVGEIPVIAAVSAPHRAEAFEACAYLMNRLKQSVPIWKKEVFGDGEEWVSTTP